MRDGEKTLKELGSIKDSAIDFSEIPELDGEDFENLVLVSPEQKELEEWVKNESSKYPFIKTIIQ